MKLSVRDAAALLNASERDIYRWIREESIPFHRVNDHYRFHRAELLEWATLRGMSVSAEAFPFSRRFDTPTPALARALQAGGVHHHVTGSDRDSVLRAIVACVPLQDESDRELLLDVTLARERLGSTGIGEGIAIPHPRSPIALDTAEPAIVLCFLDQPIDFDAIDGKPVDTFFLLITPTIRSHLFLLSRLSAGLNDPDLRSAVRRRAPAEEIIAAAERLDARLASTSAGERPQKEGKPPP